MNSFLAESSRLRYVEELEVKCFYESFLDEYQLPEMLHNIKKLSIRCYSEEKAKQIKAKQTADLPYELRVSHENLFNIDLFEDMEDVYRNGRFYDNDYLHLNHGDDVSNNNRFGDFDDYDDEDFDEENLDD